jgi:hypothetical protein
MTNFETELRDRLATLANSVPAADVAELSIVSGQRRQTKTRSSMAIAAIIVLVAGIVTSLIVNASSNTTAAFGRHLMTLKGAFAVVGPVVARSGGGTVVANRPRNCSPDEVTGRLEWRTAAYSTVGVVSLDATHCQINVSEPPSDLRAASGRPLRVPLDYQSTPGGPQEFAIGFRHLTIGLAWRGSWCGATASSIRIRLKTGTVEVPVGGPEPSCEGASTASLLPGSVGSGNLPVQSPPTEWKWLRLQLAAVGPNKPALLKGITLTVINPTDRDIALSPTPTYSIGVEDVHGNGTPSEVRRALPYLANQLVVPAHGALRLPLPPLDTSPDATAFRGNKIYVEFSMAGVKPVSTTTDVPGLPPFEVGGP